MSASDLSAELKSGKSLNDVAKEADISTDDLEAALAQAMPSSMANSTTARAMAKKMAAEVGRPKAPRHDGTHQAA